MKRLIFMMFLLFGVLSFSALDKPIIIVKDNDYTQMSVTGNVSYGAIGNFLSGLRGKGKQVGTNIYTTTKDDSKATLIIEKKSETVLLDALKYLEKTDFIQKNVDIIVISSTENPKFREFVNKYSNFSYKIYSSVDDIPGDVKTNGTIMTKSEIISGLLKELKKY